MTDPASPPQLRLKRSEERRTDGRYLIYYSFISSEEEPETAEGGEDERCPS